MTLMLIEELNEGDQLDIPNSENIYEVVEHFVDQKPETKVKCITGKLHIIFIPHGTLVEKYDLKPIKKTK